jgi:rhodanese-related sulfurtransferase
MSQQSNSNGGKCVNKVIGFCGYAQSGKDTAAGFLTAHGYERLAFADALRDSVYLLNPIVRVSSIGNADCEYERVQDLVDRVGWDVAKVSYPEIRQLLQRMGTEVGRALYGESFWVDRVLLQMDSWNNYVITDVRFPNEVEAVRSVGGKVIRIYREGVGAVNTHVSDTGVDDLEIDAVVLNQGSLDEFRQEVLKVVGL